MKESINLICVHSDYDLVLLLPDDCDQWLEEVATRQF